MADRTTIINRALSSLGSEPINNLTDEILELKELIISLQDELNNQKLQSIATDNPPLPQNKPDIPDFINQTRNTTIRHINTTDTATSTHNTTVPQEIGG